MSLSLSKKVENSCIRTAKVIILTSYTLEEISQIPYSHYMDPVSNDFTNNFGKMTLLVVLLTHILAKGGDDQTCYTTSVVNVPERWKHSIKLHRCYNKYITIFEL